MLTALYSLAILGALSGSGLAFASKKFLVEVDEKIQALIETLPGANCGACGYPGCSAYAEALINSEAETSLCAPGGEETQNNITSILGKELTGFNRLVAQVACNGGSSCSDKYQYNGTKTCQANFLAQGGSKLCTQGCLGHGDCLSVCPYDAIVMNDQLIPIINRDKCTACKKCIVACPKDLINLTSHAPKHFVFCNSTEKGAITRKQCSTGCIGCGICVKNCVYNAITMQNNLAFIDPALCTNCAICAEKCPTKSIYFVDTTRQ